MLQADLKDLLLGRSLPDLLRPGTPLEVGSPATLVNSDAEGRPTPTRLGVLLGALEPHRQLPGAWTEVVVFSDRSRASDAQRQRIEGPLLHPIRAVLAWVEAHNTEHVGAFNPTSAGQQNERLYSPEALRELVVNAFAHRDWSNPEEIRIELYPDRLVIYSPGGTMGDLDKDAVLRGEAYRPAWRNQCLAGPLGSAQLSNRLGKGLTIAVEQTRARTGKPPDFQLLPTGFVVTVPAWRRPRPVALPSQPGLILVSVGSEPIDRWVDADRPRLGLEEAPVLIRWHRRAYLEASDWELAATQLKTELLPLVEDRAVGSLHLFFKGPVALAALIGALVPQTKPLIVYHFEQNQYHPALTLDRRFLRS